MDETKRVIVMKAFDGIATMQACVIDDATDEEILAVCNRENPSGTSLGWCHVVRTDTDYPRRNPVACADYPNRLHVLVD